jgi:formate dehydrogenase major subunit
MDQIKAEVAKWTPEEVERVTGVPGSQLKRVARTLADNRPGTVIWCMGGTQHTNGNNNTRAYCILQLALGNMGVRRRHQHLPRPRQRAGRDRPGRAVHTLPGYYGLSEGAWAALGPRLGEDLRLAQGPLRHSARRRRQGKADDEREGHSRCRAGSTAFWKTRRTSTSRTTSAPWCFWGHAPNSQTRLPEMKRPWRSWTCWS